VCIGVSARRGTAIYGATPVLLRMPGSSGSVAEVRFIKEKSAQGLTLFHPLTMR